jgi:hypothetical protein
MQVAGQRQKRGGAGDMGDDHSFARGVERRQIRRDLPTVHRL